ncbi:hypothetical protein ACE3MQ_19775 [Paenibacillus lentus]
MGISKREFLEDYYYDEFIMVLEQYNEMHALPTEDADEEVFADEIF